MGDWLPNQAFWQPNGNFDPIPLIRAFRRPMLAVFDAMDANNDPVPNMAAVWVAWTGGGHPANRAVLFEHANHGLFETTVAVPVEQQLPQLSPAGAWLLGPPARLDIGTPVARTVDSST